MSLTPLFDAAPEIQIHAISAICAFFVGVFQLARPKGTTGHRIVGWTWVALMIVVAVSSLFVNTTCTFGPFSAIHLLTLLTVVSLPVAVTAARRHNVRRHRNAMLFLFVGALVIAGGFTFVPGRIMHDIVFGTHSSHERCWPA